MLSRFPVGATVPCTDLDRSRKFYTDILGLRESGVSEGEAIHYECANGTMLEVYRTRAGVGAGHTEAGWMVDDIEAVVAELRAAGVEFDEYDLGEGMRTEDAIMVLGDEKAAWFRDPDGNVLGLFQPAG